MARRDGTRFAFMGRPFEFPCLVILLLGNTFGPNQAPHSTVLAPERKLLFVGDFNSIKTISTDASSLHARPHHVRASMEGGILL